jgi:hypothetical protein
MDAAAVAALKQVQQWAKENPNRKREAPQIEIRTISDTQEGEDAPATIAGGLVPTPLEPPGPLSLVLWKTDPEFRAATAQMRRSILRESILLVTEKAEKELKGVKWQRKKVIEQIAAQQTSAVSPPMETDELDAGLAHMYNYQKLSVDEAGKKVKFFPKDPRTWSAEFPIWAATTGSRAVLHRTGEEPVAKGLATWLVDREREGWKIQWPEADGLLPEIKTKLAAHGLNPETGGGVGSRLGVKPKKEDLALALGRAETIAHLAGALSAAS